MNKKLTLIGLLSAAVISCSTPNNLSNSTSETNINIEQNLTTKNEPKLKDIRCGAYRSKRAIPQDSKEEYQNNIKKNYKKIIISDSDTIDAILVVAEYIYDKRYGEKNRIMSAHNAADVILKDYIKYLDNQEITYTAVYKPYIDEAVNEKIAILDISKLNSNKHKNKSRYELRKTAIVYVMVENNKVINNIMQSLPEYK